MMWWNPIRQDVSSSHTCLIPHSLSLVSEAWLGPSALFHAALTHRAIRQAEYRRQVDTLINSSFALAVPTDVDDAALVKVQHSI
jgi:hypothetical protein